MDKKEILADVRMEAISMMLKSDQLSVEQKESLEEDLKAAMALIDDPGSIPDEDLLPTAVKLKDMLKSINGKIDKFLGTEVRSSGLQPEFEEQLKKLIEVRMRSNETMDEKGEWVASMLAKTYTWETRYEGSKMIRWAAELALAHQKSVDDMLGKINPD